MAMPQHHFQQYSQSKRVRDVYNSSNINIDTQVSPPANYFTDQSQHPAYVPPFQVVGLAPGPLADGTDGGLVMPEFSNKRKSPLKEQVFLENNSQLSTLDFYQPRSVSTGLGLSLDNRRPASSGDSPFVSMSCDEIQRELLTQEADIERYLKLQGDQLRQMILEKVQANQMQIISSVEEKLVKKLREKEIEADNLNKKNAELILQIEQLTAEAGAWQQCAKYNENIINTLNFKLQQVYAQGRDSKEGCGDSEVDDTASCSNSRAIDFHHLLPKDHKNNRRLMTCRVCKVNEVSMVLLPCKHLCLCKECEIKVSLCPLCQSSKYIGIEVYM